MGTCDSRTSYNGSRKTQIIARSDGPVSRLEIGNDSDEASEPANPGFTACSHMLVRAVPLVIKARSCDSLRSRMGLTALNTKAKSRLTAKSTLHGSVG